MTRTTVTEWLDRHTPRPERFSTATRSTAVTARVGTWLGACFALAFATGLYSHYSQLPNPTWGVLTGPAWLYQVTQGMHVASGTAAVPLVLVKLWSVYPRLFLRPPARLRARLLDVLERASVAVLVSSALFQLGTGLANAAQWYPWNFHFRATHYALGWVAAGSLVLHVAVKLPRILEARRAPLEARRAPLEAGAGRGGPTGAPALSRRTLLRATYAAAVLAVLTTGASGIPGLRRLSVLATRSGTGPQGVPVNKSAVAAGVVAAATDAAYRLIVNGPRRSLALSRGDLEAMPQVTVSLPIACVEGWSATGEWTGVRLRDLVALVSDTGGVVHVESLQTGGNSRSSTVTAALAAHPDTLVALALGGEPLDLDHGYPCRLIAPNRPGALQTKWLATVEVQA